MVKFYLIQIRLKRIQLEDVPEKYRDKVKQELEKE